MEKYRVLDIMFFTSDIIVQEDLSKEEATKLSDKLNSEEVDNYRWYEIQKQ